MFVAIIHKYLGNEILSHFLVCQIEQQHIIVLHIVLNLFKILFTLGRGYILFGTLAWIGLCESDTSYQQQQDGK